VSCKENNNEIFHLCKIFITSDKIEEILTEVGSSKAACYSPLSVFIDVFLRTINTSFPQVDHAPVMGAYEAS